MATTSLTFSLWDSEPTASELRKEFRGKLKWGFRAFCNCFDDRGGAARWLMGWLYRHFSVRSLNDVQENKRRSLQMQIATTAGIAEWAKCGKPQKKIPRDTLERLGLKRENRTATWWLEERDCAIQRLSEVKIPAALRNIANRDRYSRLRAAHWEGAINWDRCPHSFSSADLLYYAEMEFDERDESERFHIQLERNRGSAKVMSQQPVKFTGLQLVHSRD